MWDCQDCGCQNITPGVPFCPMCFKEPDMPRSVVGAEPSDQYATPDQLVAEDNQVVEALRMVGHPHEQEPVQEPVQENVQENVQEPEREQEPADEPVPDDVPVSDSVDAPVAEDDKPDYNAYAVKDLIQLCKDRGISYSGMAGVLSKSELVDRLNEQAAQ